MTIREFALSLLRKYECNDDCYRDETLETTMQDLRSEGYTTGDPKMLGFSTEDVAAELIQIGKEVPVPKPKRYMVTWYNDSCCDSAGTCDTVEEAKEIILNGLSMFIDVFYSEHHHSDGADTLEEDWDSMIYECGHGLYEYNEETGEYDIECDLPVTYEDEKSIGWLLIEELRKLGYQI